MSIKTTGGIFGRNPTFNNVDVDGTLSIAGTAVPAPADTLVSSDIGSTVQGYDADTTKNDVANTFTATQTFGAVIAKTPANTNPLLLYESGDNSITHNFFSDSSGNGYLYMYGDGEALGISLNAAGTSTFNNNIAFANGQGIDFSATAGTGTSELFDDYEEGTWTPVLTFGGASTGITYSHQTGLYTKIGNVVKFELRIRISSVGTATGDAKITGLPFSPSSSLNGYVGRQYLCDTSGITATVPVGIVYDTATIIDLYENPGSSLARLNDTDFSANDYLTITGSYTAA